MEGQMLDLLLAVEGGVVGLKAEGWGVKGQSCAEVNGRTTTLEERTSSGVQ